MSSTLMSDESWTILLANCVGEKNLLYVLEKCATFYLLTKLAKNIFKPDDISAEITCCDWSVPSVYKHGRMR